MDGQIRNPPTAPSHLLHTTVRCLLQCKCVTKTLEGSANKHKIAAATVPGQIVLVDQMHAVNCTWCGGTHKGISTQQQYHYVTVFVDQFSGLSFVHLQKMAFKGFACSLNVHIQHYHTDNRRFCENLWMANIKKDGQTIGF
jgi:hypothetical protein